MFRLSGKDQNMMTTSSMWILYYVWCVATCAVQLVASVTFVNKNIWNATPYPKGEACKKDDYMFDVPELKDFTTAPRSCFQQLKKSQQLPKYSLRTREAAKARKLSLVTYDNVTTNDGYILKVFRVTGYENEQPVSGKPAVMLIHPVTSSSDVWFLLPGNKTLVNKLVDAGYEVWMPNVRGTSYSRSHLTLNSKSDRAYWDFSMHEVGIYDIPAIISLMRKETGTEKIFYVGHSIAANYDAIAKAEIPEINEKLHASIWLAPGLFSGHMRGFFGFAIDLLLGHGWRSEIIIDLIDKTLRGQMTLLDEHKLFLLFRLCASNPYMCEICGNLVSFYYGMDAVQANNVVCQRDIDRLVLVGNTFSFKMLTHLAENSKVCRFQKFNYGPRKNYELYGKLYPPLYNLSNVWSPVYIFYGDKDTIVTPLDQEITRKALPPGTVKGFFHQNLKDFNHVSFLYANNLDTLVYDNIVKIFNAYAKL